MTPRPPPSASDATTEAVQGWLDSVSLTLSLDCTREELASALGRQKRDQPLNEVARSYAHELTHAGQALGTTLGYYLWMLRDYQQLCVVRLLRWLIRAGQPLKTPLVDYIALFSTDVTEEAQVLLQLWAVAEAQIAEILGSESAYLHAAMQQDIGLIPWANKWRTLQAAISRMYVSPDTFIDSLGDEPVTNYDERVEANRAFGRSMGGGFDVPGVMESAALAVELSPADEDGLAQALTLASSAMTDYLTLLKRTSNAYPGLSCRSLLATHLAACDVVLNPPCLPVHFLVRNGLNFDELSPSGRLTSVWLTLGEKIRPARDIDDALRCSDEICTTLGWVPVSTVIQLCADTYKQKASNPRGTAFGQAMHTRASYAPLLHNPAVTMFGTGQLQDVFFQHLSPAFLVLYDNWMPWPGKDKNRAVTLLLDTLRHRWLRSIMIGHPAIIETPVPTPNNKDLKKLGRLMAAGLAEAIGTKVQPPVIHNPQ
jgi:hypothetical protein